MGGKKSHRKPERNLQQDLGREHGGTFYARNRLIEEHARRGGDLGGEHPNHVENLEPSDIFIWGRRGRHVPRIPQ